MDQSEVWKELPAIVELAQQAGQAILKAYDKQGLEVALKSDQSPLTRADRIGHHLITTGLQSLRPTLPVLSEESKVAPYEERQLWFAYWLVDPLDGTKEFIKRNGEFTTNIALIVGRQPVLGVIYAPALDLTYYGARKKGAFKTKAGGKPVTIAARQSYLGPPRVVVSRSHYNTALQPFLDELHGYEQLSIGSSLKFCLVAEGTADLYPRLGPTMEWDTAAGQCIVEAAGGHVTDLQGQALSYNKRFLLNPHFIVSSRNGKRFKSLANRACGG
jgi:3'(2'), 5'-bisphosphate nucleotidase